MTKAILDQLLNFGALGVFAAFLVWQHLQNMQRNDLLVERFQQQLDKINANFDNRREAMQQRYDVVISSIRKEAAQERKECQQRIDRLLKSDD